MSAWIVFSKDGLTQKCEVRSLQYSGEFLGACSITAKIVSPTPIDFEIGDYLEYRGERFEINYDPTVVKQASSGSYGEGFVYDNIVFNSLSDELTRCDFLDYVPKDNLLHYSSLPTFSFFADSVEKLAERIQVNLDRIYTGDKKWTVTVHPDFNGKKDVNISINNQTCWDALALVKNEFDGNFIIKGRNITIGTEGIALESVFSYGKGNGLISIERNAESDQKIITRLRAYGSTRNLPEHYYKNVGLKAFGEVIWLVDRDVTDHVRCYLNIPYDSKLFKQKGDSHEVKVRVNGVEASAVITEHTAKDEFEGCCELYSSSSELASVVIDGVKAYFTAYVNEDEFPKANKEYADFVPNNMAINHLMLPSFPDETIDPYIDSENIEALGIREATVFFDGSGEQEEIYPSMTGMTAEDLQAAGVECKATGALDEVVEAEFVNDDGFYKEGSTIEPFTITLKDIGFDINDHLSTDNASITMNSGMCGGREFEIVSCRREGVNYILTCNRHYDQSLDLYFPYKDFPIRGGDKFVLLNIEMPDVYVKAASQRLLTAAKRYLGNNDYVRYSYSPKVDNIFLARQHDEAKKFGLTSIYETIKEGDLMLFNDTDLQIEGSVIIDSLSIKEGDSLIPEYEITLRNNKTVGTINKIQNQIDSIVSGKTGAQGGGGYNASQIKSLITSHGSTLFLRKDKDDRSKGKIASDKAIEVGNYVSGASGAIIYKDAETGQTVGEMDKLYIRMKAYFETLEIINVNSIGGKQILSPAGSVKCIGVEELANAYRCYFLAEQDGEKVQNRFVAGDQIYSQMFDAVEGTSHNVSTHYFWRLCTGSSKEAIEFEGKKCHYIDLSITDCDKDSDVPFVGDVLNQRGNRTDLDRMNFIEQSSVDAFSPNITLFHGVNSYSLVGKEYVSYGVDKSTNKAFMNVYGEMYVGDRNGGSYMRYTQEDGLEISGRLSVDTKLGDSTLKDLISASSPEGYQEFVEKITQDIEGLQAQIDGAIESYFYQYDPTLGNYPASEWITEEQKKAHLNDTFTNVSEDSGHSWRWSLVGTTYNWVEIKDTATAKALQVAGQAQDTADGKRRVFVDTPYPPYDLGDLWSRGSEYPLMICVKTKDKNGVYEASDFDYADNNAKLKEEMQELVGNTKDELNNAIGQAKNEAVNNANAYTDEGKKALQASIDAMESTKANLDDVYTRAQADGKISETEAKALKAAEEEADAAIAYYDTIVKAYADGVATEEEMKEIQGAKAALDAAKKYAEEQAQKAIDEANDTYGYLARALGTEVDGGLLLTSLIQMRDTNQNIMSGINGLTAKGDKSIATWWGGGMLDMTDYCAWNGKEWVVKPNNTMPASVPSGLIRMDGTGYLAKGKFWWDNEGRIYADPRALFLMFDVNEEAADLSTTILAMRDKQTEFESMWRFETDKNGQKYLYSTYPLVTQGSISMMSNNGASVPSLFDSLPIDGTTIFWSNGVLKAAGGGTGGGGSIDYPLSWSGFSSGSFDGSAAKTIYIPSKLSELTNDASYAKTSDLSGYLPLSGGTIKAEEEPLTIHRDMVGSASYIIYKNRDEELGRLGFFGGLNTNPYEPFFSDKNGTSRIIIHSGNIGSQSVSYASSAGNADTLDGVHNGNVTALNLTTTDKYLNLNTITYPIFYDYGQSVFIEARENRPSGFTYGGGLTLHNGELSGQLVWSINHNSTSSTKNLYWRASNNLGWQNDWKIIAFTDSNVASATKLQTARTIWGQSFDGTGNVNGTFGIRRYSDNVNALIIDNIEGSNGYSIRAIGGYSYISFSTNKESGDTERMKISDNGNVGIGTTNPSYKLDVSGAIHSTDSVFADYSIFANSGKSGCYLHGTGISWHDSTNSWVYDLFTYSNSGDILTSHKGLRCYSNLTIDGTTTLSGATTLSSTLSVTGATILTSGLNLNGSIDQQNGESHFAYASYADPAPGLGMAIKVCGGFAQSSGNVLLCTSGSYNVGIGTTNPAYKLDVNGVARCQYMFFWDKDYSDVMGYIGRGSISDNHLYIGNYTANKIILANNGEQCLVIDSSHNVGIGTTSPSAKLHVSGNILASGQVTMNSMRSMKDIVDERGLSLSELGRIKPTRFRWKDGRDDRIHVGGIADDVMKVLPEVVFQGSDGVLSMDYGCAAFAIGASLIKPVSEHELKIKELECKVQELENELKLLKSA